MKNRLGYKSFIDDADDIAEQYEFALNHEYSIDQLDHLWISLNCELGVKIEKKLRKTRKKLKKLKKRLKKCKNK
jgi:hypothetical protein